MRPLYLISSHIFLAFMLFSFGTTRASQYRDITNRRDLQGGGGGGGGRPPPGGGGGGGITCPTTENLVGNVTGPAAAPLRGNVGCVDQAAAALRNTDTDPVMQDQDAFNIYGPMEAGFRSTVPGMSCLGDNVVSGGLDTLVAEHNVHNLCSDSSIQVLDSCGGHAIPYHYHERMSCLYTEDASTGHSTRIGTAGDGNGIYGMYIDGGVLPTDLDYCGGRYGITPDSNGETVYYYPIKLYAPFTVGCYGPANTIDECRSLYDCDSGTLETITTEFGTGEYTQDCPCFDENRSNVVGQGYPGFLDPSLMPDGASTTNAPVDGGSTPPPTESPSTTPSMGTIAPASPLGPPVNVPTLKPVISDNLPTGGDTDSGGNGDSAGFSLLAPSRTSLVAMVISSVSLYLL